MVGYRRLDSDVELAILQELYGSFTIYKNFFQPTMKLAEKVRAGGKIQRKYDEPKTPYQRLIESGQISAAARKRLKAQYESLNVAQLRRQIEGCGIDCSISSTTRTAPSHPPASVTARVFASGEQPMPSG